MLFEITDILTYMLTYRQLPLSFYEHLLAL
nr:MAG TPA: hypothetical protein [Caudoviricetes sp.]